MYGSLSDWSHDLKQEGIKVRVDLRSSLKWFDSGVSKRGSCEGDVKDYGVENSGEAEGSRKAAVATT